MQYNTTEKILSFIKISLSVVYEKVIIIQKIKTIIRICMIFINDHIQIAKFPNRIPYLF
jgi:hypothetical protein